MMIETAPTVRPPRANPVRTRADWEHQRRAFLSDPGGFFGAIARSAIHWYDRMLDAWITWDEAQGRWAGLSAQDGSAVSVPYGPEYQPWQRAFNSDDAPFYRWFEGGLTNACFNEVDRHVLMGYGDEVAFYFEGDRWDSSLNGGRGGPVVSFPVTRKRLLLETVKAAQVLRDLGLKKGDRIALNMPNIMDQFYYTEAAKRLGIIYTPVFGGFSDKTLSDRIHNAGAKIVITSDGAYRNAQIVPYKEAYTDQALDKFIPVEVALEVVKRALDGTDERRTTDDERRTTNDERRMTEDGRRETNDERRAANDERRTTHHAIRTTHHAPRTTEAEEALSFGLGAAARDAIIEAVEQVISGEITVERSDVMRGVGMALAQMTNVDAATQAQVRTAIAQALVAAPPRVDAVVVVRHTAHDILWRPERDRWSHELIDAATATILSNARAAGVQVQSERELLDLPTADFIKALYATSRPEPLDAEYPMFIIYTSGSTGKPKGVVHVHGGYVAGLAHTMKVSFDAEPGDVIYVIADPGWITGQSYMITATLASRCTGIVAEGAPVFPSAGRFASIIERYQVSMFKAGVTFLKSVMSVRQNVVDVQQYDMSMLRVATFCAEPVSPAVQQFGMELMTPQYINSYWATEHGGIVWTHFYGNDDYPLRPDAHTYPLPWVVGDVWVSEGNREQGTGNRGTGGQGDKETSGPVYRPAEWEEKGEIVITMSYPYLARTIWGDVPGFERYLTTLNSPDPRPLTPDPWKGDADRFLQTYWRRGPNGEWAYVQGDFAMKYDDGSFSLHGRSDDVINVSGHRMGTEEIEGAILRDKQITSDSPVGNCIVVGAPHREKGLTPVAFILTAPGHKLSVEDRRRLSELVRNEKGAVSVPEDYIEVSAFPETRSGKYMRRFLRSLMLGEDLGDTTTLRNPESLDEISRKIEDWKRRQRTAEEQQIIETYRYFRIEYHNLRFTISDLRLEDSDQIVNRKSEIVNQKMAIVTVTNPPVNALNERALDELNTIVDHLARREDVAAVIFTGQGAKSFVAGADIRQMLEDIHTLEDALTLPNNAHLAFRKIETMDKPCIAAINGVALGGGLEFALACHYRVADMHAEFGQPEINLRLMPGYGGTQRLPRLLHSRRGEAGMLKALLMIIGGRNVTAEHAYQVGLVDALARGSQDALSLATQMVREFLTTDHRPPTTEENESSVVGRRSSIIPHTSDDARSFFSPFHDPTAPTGIWPGLAEAFAARRALTREWESPVGTMHASPLQDALRHPLIQRVIQQATFAGRKKAVDSIIDAIGAGYAQGLLKGLEREARLFAEAVIDPQGGKQGIQDFMDKRSAPLPTRRRIRLTSDEEQRLIAHGDLLPIGAPFFPGVTPIPVAQYAQAVVKDEETGEPAHGDPITAEKQIVIPVERPHPNQVLLFMLASEVNFNDIWAITGVPVSMFDEHDRDWHVTGSGGIGLIASIGEEVKREGRIKVGDLVTIYSGQNDLLSPMVGLDPMSADFVIQGYNTPDASHQQFMIAQAPQCLPFPPDLTLEAAGSYILNLGTVYRALFTTLRVQPGRNIFIEGAGTGTGLDAARSAARNGLYVTGMVSNTERATAVREAGARGTINRRDPRYNGIFTRVPEDPTQWAAWEEAGQPMLDDFRAQNQGHLADYVISHAGETAFPRSFQLLGEPRDGHIPTLAFYGASSGYHFTFLGKPGAADPVEMLRRANLRAGEAVLIYYGVDERRTTKDERQTTNGAGPFPVSRPPSLVDQVGLEAIEAARVMGSRIVVVTYTDAQREFVLSLGFGASLKGVVSLEELHRRFGDEFDWPKTMPPLPDARADLQAFKESVRRFNDLTFKPLGGAVGAYLRSADNPRGYPDLIIERAGHDALAVSSMLIKPFVGRIVYYENMDNRRFSFFAPQVWMRQRRIYMPAANIWGTHLSNAYEVVRLNDEISAGLLSITEPTLVEWDKLPQAHQAMWENRHAGATYVVNHALPRSGLKTKDELYAAWAEGRGVGAYGSKEVGE
jgi:acrylyl-CoA reductase (NADPH)/3-hydroxypropionyl-CoA dehydratase/3-hydroxypropionyl-CoA synthetase